MRSVLRAPVLAVLGCVLALPAAACGDGPDNGAPTATVRPELSVAATPALGGNVKSILPLHGSTVTRSQTTAGRNHFGGVCASLVFEGDVQPPWLHMIIDGDRQVTQELVWFVDTFENPEDGDVCYHPEGGLEPGPHTVMLLLIDPQNLQSAPVERVEWSFEVTE